MEPVPGTLQTAEVRLELEGMTCASCAARIEKKLNSARRCRGDGQLRHGTGNGSLRDERLGGRARRRRRVGRLRRASGCAGARGAIITTSRSRLLTRRLALAVALTVPVALLAMVPPLQFSGWEWVALALSAPVVFVSGLRVSPCGAAGTRATSPRRWTRSSRSGRSRPGSGRRSCSSAGSTRTSTSRSPPS